MIYSGVYIRRGLLNRSHATTGRTAVTTREHRISDGRREKLITSVISAEMKRLIVCSNTAYRTLVDS